MITELMLKSLGIDPLWTKSLTETMEYFEINTPNRIASFIGQCMHESAGFKVLSENLNYSAEGLCKTWPKRFPSLDVAKPYHRLPDKIANRVYADRMGNGNEASGEGWKYRGRGLIQVTGKSNYILLDKQYRNKFGSDKSVVDNPDLLTTRDGAVFSAGWFWSANGINKYADSLDYVKMTTKINGGTIGIDERTAMIKKVLSVITN